MMTCCLSYGGCELEEKHTLAEKGLSSHRYSLFVFLSSSISPPNLPPTLLRKKFTCALYFLLLHHSSAPLFLTTLHLPFKFYCCFHLVSPPPPSLSSLPLRGCRAYGDVNSNLNHTSCHIAQGYVLYPAELE